MESFIQQMINGVSLGSIYALIALGYTMVYGIIKLINFAHGEIYMVGAYVGYGLIRNVGLGLIPALVLSMLFCAILGVVIEKIAYKPLRGATRIATLITAIGVSYLLQNLMIYFMGAESRAFPTALENKVFRFGGVSINNQQIMIILTTIFLMVALQVIIKYTKMGKAMRAVSTDMDAAQLMGINVDNVISFTFILGSALAGAAGVLVGIYYNSINPLMGVTPGLKAFVAAVFGGIGIVPGAMVGGYLIGLIETIVSAYGGSMYKDAVVYLILIIILIVKPSGIFGKNTKEKV
ncbi:branched-chain amino acid ABC transporter permease [Jeotgalibaca ciconiae]|uniref:Branched-chain amino acid ABC transporter permease n=1 Tax=Jeotgalibaca ciconiae TaxID=2496265 RepID=A0A3Q9BKT1_9LACT|nr:branched-chain amino acid ABC transporter permease [Jeotgalibaca ciconiae]AZP04630.1 branched-chain amino acid ABC transporter permease [Jeotgalibaca ciconiae]HJB23128.1 branched-chain amino acid ABC transporter permease [Candidatus Jeotgalibaca pullicola]